MFGVSFFEFVLIVVVALVVFGPEKLPEMARWIGKISGDFHKTSMALRREFYNAVYEPAKEDLNRARTELSQLRSDVMSAVDGGLGQPSRYEPSCPDTIAKREGILQNAAGALASTGTLAPTEALPSPALASAKGSSTSVAVDLPTPALARSITKEDGEKGTS